jgi:hypothetical protein
MEYNRGPRIDLYNYNHLILKKDIKKHVGEKTASSTSSIEKTG